jgi:hypothetical protein
LPPVLSASSPRAGEIRKIPDSFGRGSASDGGTMKHLSILRIGLCILLLGLGTCKVVEESKSSESDFSDFAPYEFLSYSGGKEIFSPYKVISSDNNWEILLSCLRGKTRGELREDGIHFSESQLMLLKAMGFLEFGKGPEPGKLVTILPILNFSEKQALIHEVRGLVFEIEPELRDDIEKLKEVLAKKGYEDTLFSILFSAVVDGLVWFPLRTQGFVREFTLDQSRPLFDGVYWAYCPKRNFRCGTNIALGNDVYMILNWSDGPKAKIQKIFHWDNLYALRDEFIEYGRVADEELKSKLIPYGVVNDSGAFTVPIIEMKPDDQIFIVCQSLAAKIVGFMIQKLDLERLQEEFGFADKEKAFVVTYHEWMWELMEHLDKQGLVKKPLAFSDPGKAGPEDIGKLFFIVRGSINP